MQVDKARLDEMLAGLEGVTSGPWKNYGGSIRSQEHDDRHEVARSDPQWGLNRSGKNASHIARCDPDTMRSIITELLELRSLRSTEGKEAKPVAWVVEFVEYGAEVLHFVLKEPEGHYRECSTPLYATTEAAEAHVAKLREALEPFARLADEIERDYGGDTPDNQMQFPPMPMRYFRNARAALTRSPE